MNWFWAIVVTAGVIGVLDAVWLGSMGDRLYRPAIGSIMRERFDGLAAGAFYVIYVLGVVVLAVHPADSVGEAAARGAALGLVAYATYDLTNRATITPFPWRVVAVDIVWGTFMTGAAATVAELVSG